MISVNDLRTGLTIQHDNNIWQVLEYQHVKQARGSAFVRTKLRNLRNNSIQEYTFRGGERIKRAHIEHKQMQYLYASGDNHAFMDMSSYEQIELSSSQIEYELNFMVENMEVNIMVYDGEIIGVTLPTNVELTVQSTEPGVRGDTVSGATKPATLETGYTVQVPLFINNGDKLIINTTDGKYVSRA